MRIQKISALTIIVAIMSGCTVGGGQVADESINKEMFCTDSRDGEVFKFNTNTVTDIRRGIGAPTTFTITTHSGDERILSSDMEAYIKCVHA